MDGTEWGRAVDERRRFLDSLQVSGKGPVSSANISRNQPGLTREADNQRLRQNSDLVWVGVGE